MMVQDQYSGYVHEVPDQLMGYGLGEVVYDGFGNAVGWNPFETISKVVSGAGDLVRGAVQGAGNVIGQTAQVPFNLVGQGVNAAGQAIGNLLPGIPGFGPRPPMMGGALPPGVPFPYPSPAGGSMFSQFPYRPPYMGGFPRPPWPTGWSRAPLPYTGLGPRRLYMRCAVWPGPQGLVPGYAANLPPGAQAGIPGLPGPYGGGGRRRRRHRR